MKFTNSPILPRFIVTGTAFDLQFTREVTKPNLQRILDTKYAAIDCYHHTKKHMLYGYNNVPERAKVDNENYQLWTDHNACILLVDEATQIKKPQLLGPSPIIWEDPIELKPIRNMVNGEPVPIKGEPLLCVLDSYNNVNVIGTFYRYAEEFPGSIYCLCVVKNQLEVKFITDWKFIND